MSIVAKPKSGIRYRLIEENLPLGDTLHYHVPVDVQGRMTQEVPVSELRANPAKYAPLFPNLFEKVSNAAKVVIRPVAKDLKLVNGVLKKNTTRRTVADIADNNNDNVVFGNGKEAVRSVKATPPAQKNNPKPPTETDIFQNEEPSAGNNKRRR